MKRYLAILLLYSISSFSMEDSDINEFLDLSLETRKSEIKKNFDEVYSILDGSFSPEKEELDRIKVQFVKNREYFDFKIDKMNDDLKKLKKEENLNLKCYFDEVRKKTDGFQNEIYYRDQLINRYKKFVKKILERQKKLKEVADSLGGEA